MTKISILNIKLIVPNNYQQFWVHFEWFLSLFQIVNFGCKIAAVTVQPKSTQKWYFFVSNPIFKKISLVILSHNPSYAKNRVKMVPKHVFREGGFTSLPPPTSMSIPEDPPCRVNN